MLGTSICAAARAIPSAVFRLDRTFGQYYDYIATLVVLTTSSCLCIAVSATLGQKLSSFQKMSGEYNMPKVNQRIVISKRLVKEGLLRLLRKKHISKVSVSALCQEAGINRTTFYRYYQTPSDVLQEIALDSIKEFSDQTASSRNVQDVRTFVVQLCAFLRDRAELVRLFMQNDAEIDFAQIFQTLSQKFLGTRVILYRGHTADDATLRLMNTFFSSGMYALIRQWLTEDLSKTPEEVADLLCCFFHTDVSLQPSEPV